MGGLLDVIKFNMSLYQGRGNSSKFKQSYQLTIFLKSLLVFTKPSYVKHQECALSDEICIDDVWHWLNVMVYYTMY